jgi:hypothetical protein
MMVICCEAPKCFHIGCMLFVLLIDVFCAMGLMYIKFVQQSNDTSLAYTLAAICNLLSEVGVSSTAGILGSSISPLTCIGISLSTQQQLFVLLRGSLKRAESLNLRRLVASNHLAKAKFDLMVRIGISVVCGLFSL